MTVALRSLGCLLPVGMIFFAVWVPIPDPMNDTPSGLKSIMLDAIEVKLWEIYLIRNRHNVLGRLSAYSIDKGPHRTESDRVTFRFMKFDWDRSLKFLLSEQFIPYEITRVFKMDIPPHLQERKVYVAEDDLNILSHWKQCWKEPATM